MSLSIPLNLRQSMLESARGAVMKAATAHGDTPTAIRLWQLAIELTSLREPEVADAYERQRLRLAKHGRQAEAING